MADCDGIACRVTDETRAPVLDPGAGKTKTGYLWALTRDDRGWGSEDPPAVVFTYAPPSRRMHAFACQATGRHGSHAMDILRGFEGIMQVPYHGLQANHSRAMDGYTGYDALAEPGRVGGKPLTLAYCCAHARRKLHDICQKDRGKDGAEGLRRIAQIYKVEAGVRGRTPEERLTARQDESAPLVADPRLWLSKQRSVVRENDLPDRFLILTTSAKSRLGEKLAYIHRHWDGLQIFLTDGRVEMDTNPVENTVSDASAPWFRPGAISGMPPCN